MKRNQKRSSNVEFDVFEAFRSAIEFEEKEDIFINPAMTRFIEAKALQHAVSKRMFLPSFYVGTASAMNMAKLRFSGDWVVPVNLYFLLVAPKGAGKTPASKCFLGPLLQLEQDEIKEYNEKHVKRNKTRAGKKRKRIAVEAKEDGDVEEDDEAIDEEEEEEQNIDDDPSSSLFHCKTRICETITIEALLEVLRHKSFGSLLLKTDEFKGWMDKIVGQNNFESVICSAFTGEDTKYTTIARGDVTLCETAISIFGCVQPGPICDMLKNRYLKMLSLFFICVLIINF